MGKRPLKIHHFIHVNSQNDLMALILIAFSVSVKNRAGTSQQTNFNEFTNAPTPSALWFDMPSTSNSTMNPLTSDSPSSQPSSKEEKTGIPKGPIELNNTSPTPSPLTILSSHQPSMLSISMLPTVKSVGPISLQPAEPMTFTVFVSYMFVKPIIKLISPLGCLCNSSES